LSPDLSLHDYVSTHLERISVVGNVIQRHPPITSLSSLPVNEDEEELANDYWEHNYSDTPSVMAVAPSPNLVTGDVLPVTTPVTNVGQIFPMPFALQQARTVTTTWDRSMAKMYQICDNARAPRYLCDNLMSKLREEMIENSFDPLHPGITKRNAFMYRIEKSIGTAPPEKIHITLESGARVTVYRFPFMETYQNYLLSEPFSKLVNLDVDPSDPFGPPDLDRNQLEEMHDGRWFKESYTEFLDSVSDRTRYVFSDLAIYADKTGTDRIEKNSLEPVVAFCPILRKDVREQTSAHFLLGFIPNLSTSSAALRRGRSQRQGSKSMSVRDYHRCLELLLAPIKKLQESQPVMYHRRGDEIKQARNYCCISGAVGDNKSHDMFSARVGDYGETTPRLSRRCMTEYSRSNNSHHACELLNSSLIERLTMGALGCVYGSYKEAEEDDAHVRQLRADRAAGEFEARELRLPCVPPSNNFDPWIALLDDQNTKSDRMRLIKFRKLRQKLCERILRKVFGSHVVDNAFFGVKMGSNKNGIFRACLADILHTIDEGIIPKLLKVIYEIMPDRQRSQVDDYVQYLFGGRHNRSGERTSYPRVSFTRGYTQLTLLAATERVGQLFVLAIILQTRKGCDLLEGRFHNNFDEKRAAAQQKLYGRDTLFEEEEEGSLSDKSSSQEDEGEITPTHQCRTSDKVRSCLRNLDLEYIETKVNPSLDCHHKELLQKVLSSTLTDRSMSGVTEIQFEPFLLDYRPVQIRENLTACSTAIHAIDYEPLPDVPIEEGRENCSIKLSMNQFSYLVETILTFEAFIKYGTSLLLRETGIAEYKRSLACLRNVIVTTISRGEGTNDWFLQKFLEMGHFLLDIIDHGSASGFSTSPFERALKVWAKRPAATAQKRSDEVFTGQVCARLHEFQLIEAVANSRRESKITENTTVQEHSRIQLKGANFKIFISMGVLNIRRVLSSGVVHPIPTEYPEEIIKWYSDNFADTYEGEEAQSHTGEGVELFTEISIPDSTSNSRTILRAHPNYQSAGSWYDFAFVSYQQDGVEEQSAYPCRIVSLFRAKSDNRPMALIQEVEFQTTEQESSCTQLFEHWRLKSRRNNTTGQYDAVFLAIPVESITDRIYAIDTVPDGWFSRPTPSSFDIVVVKYQKEEWPKSFLESPKYLDPEFVQA
jgi:hypothetical protein